MINYSYCRIFRFVGSFSHLEKGRILYGEVKNKTVLYSQILNTQNCILFKISALGLFLKYCQISQYSLKKYIFAATKAADLIRTGLCQFLASERFQLIGKRSIGYVTS